MWKGGTKEEESDVKWGPTEDSDMGGGGIEDSDMKGEGLRTLIMKGLWALHVGVPFTHECTHQCPGPGGDHVHVRIKHY